MLDSTDPNARHVHQRLQQLASGWRGWLSVGYDPEAADQLARVEAALAWATEGLLGRCTRCAGELGPEQLEQDPTDMTCIDCHDECSERERAQRARAFSRVA